MKALGALWRKVCRTLAALHLCASALHQRWADKWMKRGGMPVGEPGREGE
jgi:hypothetical protein